MRKLYENVHIFYFQKKNFQWKLFAEIWNLGQLQRTIDSFESHNHQQVFSLDLFKREKNLQKIQ